MRLIGRSICSLVLVLGFLNLANARVEAVLGGAPLTGNPNLVVSPQSELSEIMISRPEYVLSYNKDRRAPNWVAWELETSHLGKSGRSNLFAVDQELQSYFISAGAGQEPVQPSDYQGSCFDRGHQSPSGDWTDSISDNEVTFLMTNMIPQTAYLNRGNWEVLENYSRDLAKSGKKLYIIAGPIYDADFGAIGPKRDIPVPSKDFKIIYVLDENQTPDMIDAQTPAIAVIMPNTLHDNGIPQPYAANCQSISEDTSPKVGLDDWKQYLTTVQEIEAETGLTF